MRVSVLLLFCTALAFLGSCSAVTDANTFVIGARPYADKLFTREEIRRYQAGPFRKISEVKIFVTDGKARITMVQVTDLKKNGATVNLIKGGPGQTYVTLEFSSAIGASLHCMVEVYARL